MDKSVRRISTRTRVVYALAMLVGIPLLCIGLLEAGLWVFAPVKYHEWLTSVPDGHILGRMEPFQVVDNARGNHVRINKYGFRGPDYEFEKPPGVLRIEVFGGSSAFEYFSGSDEKTWPGALEKKLKERLGMKVEVINLALPGFTNFIGKINYLCNGRAFKPDVVINYETYNDMGGRKFQGLKKTPYRALGNTTNRSWWMQLARMSQIGRRGRVVYFTMTNRSMEGAYVVTDEKKEPQIARPIHPKAWAWYRQNLNDIALLTRSDNVLCVLCSQGFLGTRENIKDPKIQDALKFGIDRTGMTLDLMVEAYEKSCEILQGIAEQNDCIFFDGYRAVPHDLDHIRDAVHLFDKGSEVLAEAMASAFLKEPRFMKVVERVRAEAPGASASLAEHGHTP